MWSDIKTLLWKKAGGDPPFEGSLARVKVELNLAWDVFVEQREEVVMGLHEAFYQRCLACIRMGGGRFER